MLLERQRQVELLFKEIIALPLAEREGRLRSRAATDADLMKEVRALLSFADLETGPLDQGAQELAGIRSDDDPGASLRPGQVIGKYAIESTLGAGGMGVVYLAQQDKPRRKVALKVIRPGLASGSMLRRFEYEAEILGRLQHRGIAQVIEAGAADAGFGPQPYLAMELIDGVHVKQYVERQRLSLRARVALVASVCDGVEHAHQRGVIHRDLKPGNILVDPTGQPKILDFGVARAIAGGGAADARLTVVRTGLQQLIGTLAYMSPEQVSGHQADLDTRSDVYSLGVILFELVTGRLPHDFTDRSVPDAVRIIRDDRPADPASIAPQTRGDLATIILKALEKDREQRYQSAADLAADLRRYLSDAPIAARPPSAMYYVRKFVRRNRPLVAALALAVFALVAGFAGTLYGMIRAGQQRDEAHQARLAAEEATRFVLEEMIDYAAPNTPDQKNITLADAVRRAARVAPNRFASDPATRARVLSGLADSLIELGDYSEGLRCARGALSAAEEAFGADSAKMVRPLLELAYAFDAKGMHADANQQRARAVDISSRRLPRTHVDALDARGAVLNMSAFGNTQDMETEISALLNEYRAAGEVRSYHYNALTEQLSRILVRKGRRDEAIAIRRELIDEYRRRLGPDHASTLALMFPFVTLLVECGLYDEALAEGDKALQEMLKVYDASHVYILQCHKALAELLLNMHRDEEALARMLECMKYVPTAFPDAPLNTAPYQMTMARALCANNRAAEALPYAERSAAVLARAFGAESQIAHESKCVLGWAIATTPGRADEGLALMRDAMAALSEQGVSVEISQICLAKALFQLRRYDEAIAELEAVARIYAESDAEPSSRTRITADLLIKYCETAGQTDRAAPWRERAPH